MQLMEVHTNEGKFLVRTTEKRVREAMYAYIRAKREQGYPLSSIIYCYGPKQVLWYPPTCPVKR